MNDFFDIYGQDNEKDSIISSISSIPSNYVGSKRRLLKYIWERLKTN